MNAALLSTDVVVIGAGPVGLFSVFQCGMLGLACHVVDALDQPGGQCAMLYPEKPIYDVPGFGSIEGSELVGRLYEQAMVFSPRLHLRCLVQSLERGEDGRFRVGLDTGTTIDAGAVIIAAGAGALAPNRPQLPGIEAYEGRSVFYAVRRKEELQGKRVVIAGGGDSAVDWANLLGDVCASVTLVHRRDKFRAAPESLRRLECAQRAGRISLLTPYQLAALEGDVRTGALTGVALRSLVGELQFRPADVLLACFGLTTQLGPIESWGLRLTRHRIAVDPATCATSIEGVYAVGDVVDYPRKLKLILTGFAEAAHAAHAARDRLRPEEAFRFQHSTATGLPNRHVAREPLQ